LFNNTHELLKISDKNKAKNWYNFLITVCFSISKLKPVKTRTTVAQIRTSVYGEGDATLPPFLFTPPHYLYNMSPLSENPQIWNSVAGVIVAAVVHFKGFEILQVSGCRMKNPRKNNKEVFFGMFSDLEFGTELSTAVWLSILFKAFRVIFNTGYVI